MSGDPAAGVHRAALEALREVARGMDLETPASGLPAAIDAAAAVAAPAEGADPAAVAGMARTYLFAARVGGAAADPGRAERWLSGWSAAARRSPAEARAALVDGIRFADRLHRALGIP